MNRSSLTFAGAAVAFLCGCGSGKTGGVIPERDGGDTTEDLRAPVKPDAATPLDAAAPGPSKFGDVLLNADSYASFADTSIFAFFDVTEPSPSTDAGAPSCTFSTVGACSVGLCTGTSSGGGPAPVAASAGQLTVTGTKTYTVLPSATFGYSLDDSAAGWSPGSTIAVSASGATVPAFATTVKAPGVVKVGTPALSTSGTAPVFARSSNLALAWTGGAGAQLSVSLIDAAGTASLLCTYDASTGSASIPSSALQMLPARTGYTLYGSTSSDAANALVMAQGWTVSVSAYANAQSSGGALYSQTVTLQ